MIVNNCKEVAKTKLEQLISVTVIRKDPLFAMEFDYELNGNMEEARWKVTRHNPKYYRYGYDGLNRVTVANYGDILLTENPANGSLNLQILETNTYRGWNYAYDAIGNLERLSRNGFIGGPTQEVILRSPPELFHDSLYSPATGPRQRIQTQTRRRVF
jgi:hypothetical protein